MSMRAQPDSRSSHPTFHHDLVREELVAEAPGQHFGPLLGDGMRIDRGKIFDLRSEEITP